MSKQMKVGVTLHSYVVDLKKQNLSVDYAIRHAAGCGAKCIELVDAKHFADWPHPRLTDLFHVKELIDSVGMELVNFSQYTENEYSADYKYTEDDKVLLPEQALTVTRILEAIYKSAETGKAMYL